MYGYSKSLLVCSGSGEKQNAHFKIQHFFNSLLDEQKEKAKSDSGPKFEHGTYERQTEDAIHFTAMIGVLL
jgi:hypothetical protein